MARPLKSYQLMTYRKDARNWLAEAQDAYAEPRSVRVASKPKRKKKVYA